jgi:hypothetical protein
MEYKCIREVPPVKPKLEIVPGHLVSIFHVEKGPYGDKSLNMEIVSHGKKAPWPVNAAILRDAAKAFITLADILEQ